MISPFMWLNCPLQEQRCAKNLNSLHCFDTSFVSHFSLLICFFCCVNLIIHLESAELWIFIDIFGGMGNMDYFWGGGIREYG